MVLVLDRSDKLTTGFAHYESKRDERNRQAEIIRRLDTEIGNRISQAIIGKEIDRQRIERGGLYSPEAIYNNTVYYLNNYFIVHSSAQPKQFCRSIRNIKGETFDPLSSN